MGITESGSNSCNIYSSVFCRVTIQCTSSSTLALLPQEESHSLRRRRGSGDKLENVENSTSLWETRTFSWQEKVFSHSEIAKYSDRLKCHTPLEEKYHTIVKELESKNPCHNKRLFSYVDEDEFVLQNELSYHATTSETESANYLVKRMRTLQIHGDAESRRTMFIMADLQPREQECPEQVKSYILCKLQYEPNLDILHIWPDFSDRPYRVQVGELSWQVYEFWIENASSDLCIDKTAVSSEMYDRHDTYILASVGGCFDIPSVGEMSVCVCGEIVSAENFEGDLLYVQYILDLPKGWSTSSPETLCGVTQSCRPKVLEGKEVALFSFPFSFSLCLSLNQEDLPQWPQLFIQVLSVNKWQRPCTEGYAHITLPHAAGHHTWNLRTWQPTDNSSSTPIPYGEMRRFFIGASLELEDLSYTGLPVQGEMTSRHGFRTISSGTVQLQMNIIQQLQSFIHKGKSNCVHLGDRLTAGSLSKSVEAVLEAFSRARLRMAQAKRGLSSSVD